MGRIVPLLVVLGSGLLVAAVPVQARPGHALPPQGVYESCDVQHQLAGCQARLRTIGRAGFRLVLNYQHLQADRNHLIAYAAAARRAGVELVWPLKEAAWRGGSSLRASYPALSESCRCLDDDGMLRSVIELARSLPATWGYYVGDETPVAEAGAVARLAVRVRALDPVHPRLFVAEGTDLRRDLLPFRGAADVLGADVYPIGTPRPLSAVASVSREVTRLAGGRRRASVVLQAFSWGQYPEAGAHFRAAWPTRAQLRRQRDLALRGGSPRLLWWYSFFDVSRSDDPQRHWRDLVWAAFG